MVQLTKEQKLEKALRDLLPYCKQSIRHMEAFYEVNTSISHQRFKDRVKAARTLLDQPRKKVAA